MWRSMFIWVITPLVLLVLPATVMAREEPLQAARLIGKALRNGDRGQEVAALQQLLRSAGFDPGKVDGIYGPLTEGAVRKAQNQNGLAVDGKAGSQTVGVLTGDPAPAVVPALGGNLTVVATAADAPAGDAPRAPTATLVLHQAGAEAPAPPVADEKRQFALTFNGDPDAILLPRLLDSLSKHGAKATFFVSAEAAARNPEALRAIVAAGHQVGSSGPGPVDLRTMTPAMMENHLRQAGRTISQVTGTEPAYFRPYRGLWSTGLQEAAGRSGQQMVLWTNVNATDVPGVNPVELAARLQGAVYDGAVLMIHQDRPAAVIAVDLLLQALAGGDAQTVSLSDLDD